MILLSPAGRKFDQAIARELAGQKHLLLVTGHYEGFDERVREQLADDELSIGDYVLTNGALPAMVVIDAVTRLLPGVLGDDESSQDESFSRRAAGISAIHAAGGISRDESARTCCCPATTPRSKNGGANRRSCGRKNADRIC